MPNENKAAAPFFYGLSDCTAFVADGEGNVYAAFSDSPLIKKFDSEGSELSSFDFGEGEHTNLCLDGEMLYALTRGDSSLQITFADTKSGEIGSRDIEIRSGSSKGTIILSADAMCAVGGYLYVMIREGHDYSKEAEKFDEYDDYYSLGERALKINPRDGNIEDIAIDGVVNLSKTDSGRIMFYAYDAKGGYCFTEFDTAAESFSERIYNNLGGSVTAFSMYGDLAIMADFRTSRLFSVDVKNSDSKTEFLCDVAALSGNDICCINGSCYVLARNIGDIVRVPAENAVSGNKALRFCSPEIYTEVPFGCGFEINSEMLNDEEFALKILSSDKDYDICMMSSSKTFSREIRDNGAFYPLNDVPYVKEYLDSCFPYIKDAAADENGEIWMLPIAVDVPFIMYNEKNCAEYGLDIKSADISSLYSAAKALYEKPEMRDRFLLNGYAAAACMINEYHSLCLSENAGIDYTSEMFGEICDIIENNPVQSDYLHTWLSREVMLFESDGLVFELRYYRPSNLPKNPESYRAAAFPKLSAKAKNTADCYYFCVNLNSDSLETALGYISAYCRYMLQRKDTYVIADRAAYTNADSALVGDLYEIYANARVCFGLPKSVFEEDYVRFINGETGRGEFISEISRKVNMYLGE